MSNYIGPEKCLEKKKKYIIPCLGHFYTNPTQFVKGEMQYLYDYQGKKYLDCFAGVSVINCGHCNPEITSLVAKQVETLQHVCNIYLTENIYNLAEKLSEITPGSLQKSFFCSTGTEANEGALLLANLYTGKKSFIALQNGLHGRTKLTMNLTGIDMWRTDPYPINSVYFAANPYCYRCPMGQKKDKCNFECIDTVEKIIAENKNDIAAMIVEPIQGNAGIIVPPDGYFIRLKKLLEENGILLIVDEVQTGFARTGKMFAIENYGIEPDIMTMAKALGNGAPISAFITNEKIADVYTKPGASTLGGNPVSTTAGLAVIDYIQKYNLIESADKKGKYLFNKLVELKNKYNFIGDIRGKGLMIGAELVNDDLSPSSDKLEFIVEEMLKSGFVIGKNGIARNVLAFQPPLVISNNDIDSLIENLDRVMGKLL